MRKQQKADEEAERIRKYTASQVAENQAKYSTHKKKQVYNEKPVILITISYTHNCI